MRKVKKLNLNFYLLFLILFISSSVPSSLEFIPLKAKAGQTYFVDRVCKSLNEFGYSKDRLIILDNGLSPWLAAFRTSCSGEFVELTTKEFPSTQELLELGLDNVQLVNPIKPLLISSRPFANAKRIKVLLKDFESTRKPIPTSVTSSSLEAWVGEWDSRKPPEFLRTYLNLQVNQTYAINSSSENLELLNQGWSTPESWGIWSSGRRASINIKISPRLLKAHLQIILKGTFLVNQRHPLQRVRIAVNDGKPLIFNYIYNSNQHDFGIKVPFRITKDGTVTVSFEFLDAIQPASIGINEDKRFLAFGLKSVTVEKLSLDPA